MDINYPCVMSAINDSSLLVLFVKKGHGIIIRSKIWNYLSYAKQFRMDKFEFYYGKYTLPINEEGYPKLKEWVNSEGEVDPNNIHITLFTSSHTGVHLKSSYKNDIFSKTLCDCNIKRSGSSYYWRDYNGE